MTHATEATQPPLRAALDRVDAGAVRALLARDPRLATTDFPPSRDHPLGAGPLGYLAMLRYDCTAARWRDVPGTGPIARLLLAAGAPVDGGPGSTETPLMTAASYGDAEVAQVLVDAGADLEAVSAPDSGGVPNATALVHAAVFGMTPVVDVLVAAGAVVPTLLIAAAAGDVSDHALDAADPDERVRALVMAADHERLDVVDALLAAGTPVDAVDRIWNRQALRVAAENGRVDAVRHLLARGADPTLTDGEGGTALDLCRAAQARYADPSRHRAVEALLAG